MTYKLKHSVNALIGPVAQFYIEIDAGHRVAKCYACGLPSASLEGLPDYTKCIDKPNDLYYCGCQGFMSHSEIAH